MAWSGISWHVAPRYTSGSPAMVTDLIARQVARQEEAAYLERLPAAAFPDLRALQAIVYSTMEAGRCMHVMDELTQERFLVPIAEWRAQHWHERSDRFSFLVSRPAMEKIVRTTRPATVPATALGRFMAQAWAHDGRLDGYPELRAQLIAVQDELRGFDIHG